MDCCCKSASKGKQFFFSFFSAIIYQAGFQIIMESCNFTVYYVSYIHYKQKWVDMNYGNLMRPVFLLFLAIFSPLSGVMENCCGPRISIVISSFIVGGAFVGLYFLRNIWYFYGLTFLLGVGSGISNQIIIKNCCYFYPRKKGVISASIATIGSLFGAGYSFLGEKFINPKRADVIDKKTQPYYEEKIAEKSKYFFLFASGLIGISCILSIIFYYRYDPSSLGNEEIENEVNEINGPLTGEINEDENVIDNNQNNKALGPPNQKNIRIALSRFRFWRNILLVGAMPIMIWFEGSTSRAYCAMIGVSGKILGIMAGTLSIIGCITNPLWALCVDLCGFRPIMVIISFLTIGLSVFFYIFMGNSKYYIIGVFASAVLRGGLISSLVPHLMHIFGLKYFLTLGGLGRLFTQVFSFGAAAASIVISYFFKNPGDLLKPYRIVTCVGAGFALFGFILAFFENDEIFDYGDDDKFSDDEEKGETKEVKEEEKKEQDEKEETEQKVENEENIQRNEDEE